MRDEWLKNALFGNVLIISFLKCEWKVKTDPGLIQVDKKRNGYLNFDILVESVLESMPGSPTGMRERDLRSSLVAALLATLFFL